MDLFLPARDVVAPYLDQLQGHTVTHPDVFRRLAAQWETSFFSDMARLNVMPADLITRVSEFVPEIVAYVERIITKGYAYAADGSVYFDTGKFDASEGQFYAKLEPQNYNAGQGPSAALMAEGEGALGMALVGKKHPADFALWKKSRPGEPSWPSPWGEGRPGWHIECSVMASAVTPGESVIDIHSGGEDLKFPHHDNEVAQSEAYFAPDGEGHQWINYFLHMGHLHIEGQKMSKSLKNFVTIGV